MFTPPHSRFAKLCPLILHGTLLGRVKDGVCQERAGCSECALRDEHMQRYLLMLEKIYGGDVRADLAIRLAGRRN